ncbi:MAG: site-specific integrase [Rhodanobacter sp.]
MATKRKRNNRWHYVVKRQGLLPQPIYLSFEDEVEGDEYVRRIEALLDRGVVPDEFKGAPASAKGLRDGISRYLDAQHIADEDLDRLRILIMRLPRELALSSLTFVWAQAWVTRMKREENLAPGTIRKHVGALARALDWLAAQGELPFNPLRLLPNGYASYSPADASAVRVTNGSPKQDIERDRRLEPNEEEEVRRLLAGEKPKHRQRALELNHGPAVNLLFDMALESAMRMREMFTLLAKQVDLPRRTVFLDKTKNGDKRQVPISSVLHAALEPYIADLAPDDQLFPWWNGVLDRKELARTTSLLSRQFSRIFDAAECGDVHFHDLRHEATSRLFERTSLSDMEIAKITGHKSLAMLKRYANLRGSNLAARLW